MEPITNNYEAQQVYWALQVLGLPEPIDPTLKHKAEQTLIRALAASEDKQK